MKTELKATDWQVRVWLLDDSPDKPKEQWPVIGSCYVDAKGVLWAFIVCREYRGKGYGHCLMREALNNPHFPVKGLYIGPTHDSPLSLEATASLYEKHGFKFKGQPGYGAYMERVAA